MMRFEPRGRRRVSTARTAMEEPAATPSETAAPPPAQAWQLSTCLNILGDIQEQIRFADSKAGFIAAFNVLLFGFVANHVDKLRALCTDEDLGRGPILLALVLVAIYVTSMVTTFGLVVSCVVSRFAGRVRQSRVFFAHIADQYGRNHKRYGQDLAAMTSDDWLDELSGQLVEVSRLAVLKHKKVRWAAYCTLFSVLLWIGSLVTIVSACWLRTS
jgi:hypothetical protein